MRSNRACIIDFTRLPHSVLYFWMRQSELTLTSNAQGTSPEGGTLSHFQRGLASRSTLHILLEIIKIQRKQLHD